VPSHVAVNFIAPYIDVYAQLAAPCENAAPAILAKKMDRKRGSEASNEGNSKHRKPHLLAWSRERKRPTLRKYSIIVLFQCTHSQHSAMHMTWQCHQPGSRAEGCSSLPSQDLDIYLRRQVLADAPRVEAGKSHAKQAVHAGCIHHRLDIGVRGGGELYKLRHHVVGEPYVCPLVPHLVATAGKEG
jgi:hypothetical protein